MQMTPPNPAERLSKAFREEAERPLAPGLYVVATPIGHLCDITIRALSVLSAADVVYCEDTRLTRRLLERYGLATELSTYHEHNAQSVRPHILARLREGQRVALVSDAGTPLISDPGYKLVSEARGVGAAIVPVPGASAVLAGLIGSGLPTDRFLFAGFAPAKSSARQRFFQNLALNEETLIFFESPQRLKESLADLHRVFGDRQAAVGRELTKRFEEIARDGLEGLCEMFGARAQIKGEIVLVVAGAPARGEREAQDFDPLLKTALEKASVREAADAVALVTGERRKTVYARALELSGKRGEA